MSFTDFSCRHCRETRAVETSRVVKATFIRCDACFAISSLSLGERLAMINAASRERLSGRRAAHREHAASA